MNFGLFIVSKWIENGFSSSDFPLIMMPKLWTHLYRKAADDKDKRNERIKFSKNINDCFEEFDSTRRSPETKHTYLGPFACSDIEHLYFFHYTKYFSASYTKRKLQTNHLILEPSVRLYLTFYAVSAYSNLLATKAAKSIELYKEYKDANIELKDLNHNTNVFNDDTFESISDYAYAKNNSAKLVRFSAELLKEAISKPELKIKTRHAMPRPSNNMLFVPLSGLHAMHGVLERCLNAGLKISQQVYTEEYSFEEKRVFLFCNIQLCALLTVTAIQHIPALMGPASFEDHYEDVVWKNNLWETLFNLDHIQKKRGSASQGSQPCARLEYGWKTDGHMVIVLFIKKAIEQIPQDDSETNFMKRKVNLTNWSKGLYPLKKEPTSITMNDQIIGLDPDMNTILKISNCSASEIIDKKTVKENTTKFSNAEYEMRSGFEWARKIELKNREAAGIQQVYSKIPVVDSVNSSELLKYLRVISRNRKKIFDFMKGYRHRETKAYLVQNRQVADSHMCDLVLGQTAAGAPYTLAHRTNSKKRKKAKNTFKKASGIVAKEAKS
ncbi:hypothetical protein RMATCC62417_10407 [Rhizopus microsporus]|nr:hypothetical protein RMATCC62417_10407 [Rhizopus microsporus]